MTVFIRCFFARAVTYHALSVTFAQCMLASAAWRWVQTHLVSVSGGQGLALVGFFLAMACMTIGAAVCAANSKPLAFRAGVFVLGFDSV